MGNKKTTTQNTNQNTTQTAAPPSWTLPGLEQAGSMVSNALGQVQQLPRYSGDFVAQPDAGLVDQAVNAYTGSAGLAGQLAGKVNLDGYDLGPNAQLSGVIDNAINPVRRALMEEWLPSIRSSSLDSGAYSGDRAMAVLPTNAIRNATESADRLAADVTYKDYTDRENRRLEAYQIDQQMTPELLDTVMRMSTSQGDLLSQALGLKTGAAQAGIDNALAADSYGVSAPFRGLDIASQILATLGGNYGTSTGSMTGTTKTTEKTGGLGSIVQGLTGLAGAVGGAMTGLGGVGNLLGTAKAAVPAASVFQRIPTSYGLNPSRA